jgi:tetratricopeptide (TPR) repeat protein
MRSLALTALETDDLASTSPLLRRARELFEKIGKSNDYFECAFWQGRVSLRRGSQSVAEGLFKQAVDGFRGIGNKLGEGEAGYWLGVSLRQQGKLSEAWTVFTECELPFRQIGSVSGVASALLGRAIVHLFREELDESEAASQRAHMLYSSQGDDVGVADSLNAMAEVARAKGDLSEAELRYRQAVSILSRARASRAVLPQLNLALVVLQRGDCIEGKELLDTVAIKVEHQGKRALLGAVHALYLVVAASAGDALMWTKHLRTTTLLLQETGAVDPDIAWAMERAGTLSAEKGRSAQAKAAWEIAHDQWSRLGRDRDAQRVLALSLDL